MAYCKYLSDYVGKKENIRNKSVDPVLKKDSDWIILQITAQVMEYTRANVYMWNKEMRQ